MKAIGIDIGTTTICAIVMDADSGRLSDARTLPNTASIEGRNSYEKMQNPSVILTACQELLASFLQKYPDIISIGVTGAMHGILYLDSFGQPVTPLYTWQDGCGSLPYDNTDTYAQYLTKVSGYPMATGFGLTTHFYLTHNHSVPDTAVSLCTIPDYIAMSLSGLTRPRMHPSMAASLGLYDIAQNRFDKSALQRLSLDSGLLPEIAVQDIPLGYYQGNIPVSAALGDNQASFLGSVNADANVLVNVGTGSQISVCCDSIGPAGDVEYRPYLAGTYLMAGSSLCGGYAYALLKNFFEQTAQMLGAAVPADIYERMNAAGSRIIPGKGSLLFDTRFQGTRKDPSVTASINGLTASNFSPDHLVCACLHGICEELYSYYIKLPRQSKHSGAFVGSGNGIRKNPLLKQIFQETFGMPLSIPLYSEEASYGAALYSLLCGNYYSSLEKLQQLIQYTD